MKSYKLIKEYPGSHDKGKIIASTTMEYIQLQPQHFPEFWEEVPSIVSIKTVDGVDLCEGEMCWTFNTNCIVTNFIVSKYHLAHGMNKEVFSSRKAAEDYLISKINIPLEDCVLLGCNVPIYSVLPKSTWDERETTSLGLWIRIMMGRNTANWKYFRHKEARDAYVKAHKPMFSSEQVIQACKEHEVPSPIYWRIIKSLRGEN